MLKRYLVKVGGYDDMKIKAYSKKDAIEIAQSVIRLKYNNLKRLTDSNSTVKLIR